MGSTHLGTRPKAECSALWFGTLWVEQSSWCTHQFKFTCYGVRQHPVSKLAAVEMHNRPFGAPAGPRVIAVCGVQCLQQSTASNIFLSITLQPCWNALLNKSQCLTEIKGFYIYQACTTMEHTAYHGKLQAVKVSPGARQC